MYQQEHKSVLFGHKWSITASGIAMNNPKIIDLFSYKVYDFKNGYGIVNYNHYNPRCIYSPLVPKRDAFYVADGSPQLMLRGINLAYSSLCY